MDIRILALLVLIGAVATLADPTPYSRIRRNGRPEDGRASIVEPIGMSRRRREVGQSNGESENSNETESTTSQTTTQTSSTPAPTSQLATDSSTPAPNPTTRSNKNKAVRMTTSTQPSPDPTPSPTPERTNPPRSTSPPKSDQSTSSKPAPTGSQSQTTRPAPLTDKTPASSSAPPADSASKSTSKPEKPSDSGQQSTPKTPFAKPGLRSNFNTEKEPNEPAEKSTEPPSQNPAPSSGPALSSRGSFSGYPPMNSIPGAGNYAWTGTHTAPGSSSAFATAGASAGASAGAYPAVGGYPDPGMSFVNSRGGFVDNRPNYPPYGNGGASLFGPTSFAFPQNFDFDPDPFGIQRKMDEHFRQLQQQIELQQRAFFDASNSVGNGAFPSPGDSGGGVPQTAFSSISVGPGGGFQRGFISPAAPHIESRFNDNVPPPSGNTIGVFSSSSSSSGVGPDGKPFSRKSATTGYNDNGKITFRTVHD